MQAPRCSTDLSGKATSSVSRSPSPTTTLGASFLLLSPSQELTWSLSSAEAERVAPVVPPKPVKRKLSNTEGIQARHFELVNAANYKRHRVRSPSLLSSTQANPPHRAGSSTLPLRLPSSLSSPALPTPSPLSPSRLPPPGPAPSPPKPPASLSALAAPLSSLSRARNVSASMSGGGVDRRWFFPNRLPAARGGVGMEGGNARRARRRGRRWYGFGKGGAGR